MSQSRVKVKNDIIKHPAQTLIDHILQKLSHLEIPSKEYLDQYMRHKWRLNHKPRTLQSSFTSVMLFLAFYGESGKRDLKEIERVDLEAFIEHEQYRGSCISTVRTRLASIIAFFHFLIEQDVISEVFLKRSIKLKLPDALPRAMNPADVKKFLSVDDALFAIKLWLRHRDKEFVFYGHGNKSICYSTGRSRFVKYIKKAGLEQKGYTVHCLRHTFASELLYITP